MRIIDSMFYLPIKYSQSAITISIKKITLAPAYYHFWLSIFLITLVDSITLEFRYQIYSKLN